MYKFAERILINIVMIYELTIPSPSEEILQYCKELAKTTAINHSSIEKMSNICGPNHNVVSGVFTSDEKLNKLVCDEYNNFFKDMAIMIGVLENTKKEITGCYPPHTDISRYVAINYYIDLGGDNVETIFYKNRNYYPSGKEKNLFSYEEVDKLSSYIFEKNKWYVMDARQCHSVENIMYKRTMLSISFFVRFDIFIDNYKLMIKHII